MAMNKLDELRALLDEATPGPWWWDSYSLIGTSAIERDDPLDRESCCDDCECPAYEHTEFYRKNRKYRICAEFRQAERESPYARVATMGNTTAGHGDQLHDGRQINAAQLIVFLRNHAEDLLAVAQEAEKAVAKALPLNIWTTLGEWNGASIPIEEFHGLRNALTRLSPTSEEGS